jgi:hypothetical protein
MAIGHMAIENDEYRVPPTATPCIVGCMMIRRSTIGGIELAAERIEAGKIVEM